MFVMSLDTSLEVSCGTKVFSFADSVYNIDQIKFALLYNTYVLRHVVRHVVGLDTTVYWMLASSSIFEADATNMEMLCISISAERQNF